MKLFYWSKKLFLNFSNLCSRSMTKLYRTFVFLPTQQPLKDVGVLFSPMVSGWLGGRREKVCLGCISEALRCKKLILDRDVGYTVKMCSFMV